VSTQHLMRDPLHARAAPSSSAHRRTARDAADVHQATVMPDRPANGEVLAEMSGWSAVPRLRDHDRPTPREEPMLAKAGRHDPFWDDGKGARRRNRRVRFEAALALALAIAACGLTAAMWLRQVLPVLGVQI
jgi:hypothetical protein